MLDDVPLEQKLTIALEWIRGAMRGDFDLANNDAQGLRFLELLGSCKSDALVMSVQREIDAARILVLTGHLALLGHDVPVIDPFNLPKNVALLRAAPAGRNQAG